MKVSIHFTPQAQDDYITFHEDDGGGFTDTDFLISNDLAQNAERVWGIFGQSEQYVQDNIGTLVGNTSPNGDSNFNVGKTQVDYDADTGDITITFDTADFDYLAEGEQVDAGQFTYVVRLASGAFSTATAHIIIVGDNDAPVISVQTGDSDSVELNETDAALTAGDTITVNDPDLADTVTMSVTGAEASVSSGYDAEANQGLTEASYLGMFGITAGSLNADPTDVNNVTWSFDSTPESFDFLQAGEDLTITYHIQAKDNHNVTDEHDVTVTIHGTNDAAVISDAAGADFAVTEDSDTAAGGTLLISDADHDEASFASTSTLAGKYGAFTFNLADGAWTYTLDNSDPDLDDLDAGESDTETLTVTSLDGTTHDIVVTVNGADEVVSNHAPGPITFVPAQNGNDLTAGNFGHFIATDPDGDPLTYALAAGSSAGVAINSSGELSVPSVAGTYTVNVTASDGSLVSGPTTFLVVVGTNSGETLNAAGADNNIEAGLGNADTLNGSVGVDYLLGGSGNDILKGFGGADYLYGGGNADTFTFTVASDSTVANSDTILDFGGAGGSRDHIDLSGIDSGTLTYTGNTGTVSAHSVNWFESGGNTIIQADVSGDGTADFQVILVGTGLVLTASDFTL